MYTPAQHPQHLPTRDQQLTQHVDRGGGADTGHQVGGRALPDTMLLLDEWAEDEAAVPIHLGTTLPHATHLHGKAQTHRS